ncbi:MAG TPA: peptidoglycan-binding domain-containing protein [Thermoanaerobaculia bacterium]|nr:peptidoglycan-binding domain-containing protein [Thermoanaerobaculia bacterium]
MAPTGIPRIDDLFTGGSAAAIAKNDADTAAVGVVQDLLSAQGFTGLPGLLDGSRGKFGPKTTDSVSTFQQTCGLPVTGAVDHPTLQQLASKSATRPSASQGYLCLTLDVLFQGMTRLVGLTSQFEGAGLFAALNKNTDRAGLSFGLIQWAQKPRRLHDILAGFQSKQPDLFVQVFGGGDASLAQGLLTHTAKPNGGVDSQGKTTDSRFDLIQDPWVSRFRQAALDPTLQRVQLDVASAAFNSTVHQVQGYAPDIRSERGIAFMLDLANQHGDGGAKSIYTTVAKPGMSEADLMKSMEAESVARVQRQFGPGSIVDSTRNRREAFRTTPLLSDQPFRG